MNRAFVIVMMTLLVLPGFASAPTDDLPLWKRLIAIVAPGPGYTARVLRVPEPAVREEAIATAPAAPPVVNTSTFTAAVSEIRVTEAAVTAPAAETTSSIPKTASANPVAPANATASTSAVTSASTVTSVKAPALANTGSQPEQPSSEPKAPTVSVIAKVTTADAAAKAEVPRAEVSTIAKAFETIATQSAAPPADAPRATAPPAQPPSVSAQPSKSKRSSKTAKREAPAAEPAASPPVYQVASVTPAGAAAAVKAARPDAVPADDESATEFQGDPDALPPMPRPAPLKGSCNGGRRIISAFYWEGTHTASGQRFDPNGMTAAHRTLPFGTQLTVGNPRTGKTVIVTINDRGPYVSGVSLDLSRGAAKAIGLQGTGAVCIL